MEVVYTALSHILDRNDETVSVAHIHTGPGSKSEAVAVITETNGSPAQAPTSVLPGLD